MPKGSLIFIKLMLRIYSSIWITLYQVIFNLQKIDKKDFDVSKSFNPNNLKTNREKYVIVNKLDIFREDLPKNLIHNLVNYSINF